MSNNDTSSRKAIQALIEEIESKEDKVSIELVKKIYDIEEGVQFLDDRGPIANRIAKLVRDELAKEDT